MSESFLMLKIIFILDLSVWLWGKIMNMRAKNNSTWSPNVFSMINWEMRMRDRWGLVGNIRVLRQWNPIGLGKQADSTQSRGTTFINFNQSELSSCLPQDIHSYSGFRDGLLPRPLILLEQANILQFIRMTAGYPKNDNKWSGFWSSHLSARKCGPDPLVTTFVLSNQRCFSLPVSYILF